MQKVTTETIDALLPQTQCGLCSYKGCRPYAEAIAEHQELINRCPPGGVPILLKLAEITGQDANPYIADMEQKAKAPSIAVIREDACIGCTKCIQACPVDAIVGSGKQMHTVISSECTGCELCIAPCPTDCIDMIPVAEYIQENANNARKRYYARQQRLQNEVKTPKPLTALQARKLTIKEAVARAKAKKLQTL